MRSVLEQYQRLLNRGEWQPDKTQALAVEALNTVAKQLMKQSKRGFFASLYARPVKGLYLYGGVGRGKTMMMDLFFECMPNIQKRRAHFNRFMEEVHARLTLCRGHKDPITILSNDMAREYALLCFDEFYIEDIADAMVLGKLIIQLFQRGICVVATGNQAPTDLYKGGLNRACFLPAIKALQQHATIINVDGGLDYRTARDEGHYYFPLAKEREWMQRHFDSFVHKNSLSFKPICIQNRLIQSIAHSQDVVWFDFNQICETTRAKADYIEIADRYKVVFISNIPQLDADKEDAARRFIALIDELYDNRTLYYISAEVSPNHLYCGERHVFAFKRTLSRIA